MDWRAFPPMASLRAFAALAEHGTLTEAGAALGVSHAAISQQLRSLEAHLGVPLVDRSGRALRMTEAGDVLAQACTDGFGTLSRAVADITGASDARALHITTTPTFAATWLMPRLPAFQAVHPGINLLIDPTPAMVDLVPGGMDVAIRYGVPPWPGLEAQMLLHSPMVVVASPNLVEGMQINGPSDLADLPWLEELGTTESSNWLRKHGAQRGREWRFVQVPGNLLLDGARGGQGVAVTVRAFVEDDIRAGRLVELFEEPLEGAGYHVVTRPGVMRPALRAFHRWVMRQSGA